MKLHVVQEESREAYIMHITCSRYRETGCKSLLNPPMFENYMYLHQPMYRYCSTSCLTWTPGLIEVVFKERLESCTLGSPNNTAI